MREKTIFNANRISFVNALPLRFKQRGSLPEGPTFALVPERVKEFYFPSKLRDNRSLSRMLRQLLNSPQFNSKKYSNFKIYQQLSQWEIHKSRPINMSKIYSNAEAWLMPLQRPSENVIPLSNSDFPSQFWFQNFEKSNQNTAFFQRPISHPLQWIQKGDLLGDCMASTKGELALGRNLLVAYMPWEGFNFEDAVLINHKVLSKYTSLHIEKYDFEITGQITRNIPEIRPKDLQNLDKNGIIKIGSWVQEGDILVGKIIPSPNQTLLTHEKLLSDIVGQKSAKSQEKCLRANVSGRVIRISYFTSEKNCRIPISHQKIFEILPNENEELSFPTNEIFQKTIPIMPSLKLLKSPYAYGCIQFYFLTSAVKNKINISHHLSKKTYLFSMVVFRWIWLIQKYRVKQFRYRLLKIFKSQKVSHCVCQSQSKSIYFFKISSPRPVVVEAYPKVATLSSASASANVVGDLLANEVGGGSSSASVCGSYYYYGNGNEYGSGGIFQNLFTKRFKNFISINKRNLLRSYPLNNRCIDSLKHIRQKVTQTKLINSQLNVNGDDRLPSTNLLKKMTIYIANKREFQVGDKISGRHGNKGIISQIFSNYDMPYLSNGCTLDVLLNPLGVPSRMNVGQILECLLGFAGQIFHTKFQVLCFDEMYGYEASRSFIYSKLFDSCKKTRQKWLFSKKTPGKLHLFDGRNGELFHQSIIVGSTYLMKLIHIVDEKIHARATGPYSLITQQPLRGRAKHGGQRVGEMEVWALQGFGSAYTLQELLTVKSDDLQGRNQIMQTLLKNTPLRFGTSESLRVVLRELQCLCLDLQIY